MIGAILGGLLLVGFIIWGALERFRIAPPIEQPDNWQDKTGGGGGVP